MAAEPTKRDPRIEPRRGDILRNKERFNPYRCVTGTNGSMVYYTIRRGSFTEHSCSLNNPKAPGNWQRWAKNAEVIHAAG